MNYLFIDIQRIFCICEFLVFIVCCVTLTTIRFRYKKIISICFQWYTTTSKDHSSACRGRRKRPRVVMWISSASKASPYRTCPPWMTRPLQTKESSNSSRTAASTWSPLSPPPPNHFPRSNSLPREMLISKPKGLGGNEWHYASTGSKIVTLLFFSPGTTLLNCWCIICVVLLLSGLNVIGFAYLFCMMIFFLCTILWEVLYMYIIWYLFDFVYDYGIDFYWILHLTIITK